MNNLTTLFITIIMLLSSSANSSPLKNESNNITNDLFSFSTMRIIYLEKDKKGVSISFKNNTNDVFLMQSWVQEIDNKKNKEEKIAKIPFIVTPPLQRFEAKSDTVLRIRRINGELPSDVESVFFLSTKIIPNQERKDSSPLNKGKVTMTVVTKIKLFYRPEGLKRNAIGEAAHELTFNIEKNAVIANNPTPYWLTFSKLTVGKHTLDEQKLTVMVPPKSSAKYSTADNLELNDVVEWQLIDEDGWNTPILKESFKRI